MKKFKSHIETIYCDDIRHELGNKLSFMGVYSGDLYVRNFPTILPGFCVVIKLVSFTHEKIPPMTVKIMMNGEVIREQLVEEDDIAAEETKKNIEKKDFGLSPEKTTNMMFKFSNFNLEKEGVITIRALIEGEDEPLKGLALKILKPA